MKKILVIGGTGAIGRHTVKELLEMGYKVDVLSLDDVKSDNPNLNYMVGPGKDIGFMKELVNKGKYDGIIDYMIYTTPEFADLMKQAMPEYKPQDILDMLSQITLRDLAINFMLMNSFLAIVLSLPTAFVARLRKQ